MNDRMLSCGHGDRLKKCLIKHNSNDAAALRRGYTPESEALFKQLRAAHSLVHSSEREPSLLMVSCT